MSKFDGRLDQKVAAGDRRFNKCNCSTRGGPLRVPPHLTPDEKFSVVVHEKAPELLHGGKRGAETTKNIHETKPEAVAFVAFRTSGIDRNDLLRDYIQVYNGDKGVLMDSLSHIQRGPDCVLPGTVSRLANGDRDSAHERAIALRDWLQKCGLPSQHDHRICKRCTVVSRTGAEKR